MSYSSGAIFRITTKHHILKFATDIQNQQVRNEEVVITRILCQNSTNAEKFQKQ